MAAESGSNGFAAWSAVDEDAVAFGAFNQDRFALADVEEGYGEASLCWSRSGEPKQAARERKQQRKPTSRK